MKKKSLIKLVAMLSLCLVSLTYSNMILAENHQNQTRKIEGLVLDVSGEPLIGLTVAVKGTTNATVTDIDGKYTINAKTSDILVFTYMGYQAQEVDVKDQSTINVIMREASVELDDIVVVGYGTQKKVSVTGSVTTASVKELQSVPSASLSNTLGGQLPGLITRQYSGEPGFDGAQLYIRGMATFNDKAPIVLVDGVERDINLVNSQEVESFSILKDASATAVYGVRGANGVILITTKKGVKGKPKVTLRSEWAQLTGLRFPKYIQSYEFATLMNEATTNSGMPNPWTNEQIQKFKDGSDPYLYPNVNWVDEVYRKNSWQSVQNLTVSGGDERVRYYMNLGFTGKDGLYREDKSLDYDTNGGKFRRYNLRSNIDVNITKEIVADMGLTATIQDRAYQGTSAGGIHTAIRKTSPLIYPVRNPDGSIAGAGATEHLLGNPYGLTTQSGYAEMFVSTIQGNTGIRWDLSKLVTKGLSMSGKFAFDHHYFNEVFRKVNFGVKQYLGKDADGNDKYQIWREQGEMGYKVDKSGSNYSMYWEAAANYDRSFGNHAVTGMLLFNRREYKDLTAGESIYNIPYRHQGVAGRFSYNYGSRYLAEVNFGYNGSEQFPKGDRYGFFPSLSLGWVVSGEDFWNKSVVSHLKIRGSAGQVGNDQIGTDRFLYLTMLNKNAAGYHFGASHQHMSGIEEKKFGLPLRWEKATKYNLGFDLGLFDKLTLQFDAFKEERKDILLKRDNIPMFVGLVPHGKPYGNVGAIDNKGFDASIEFRNTTSYGLFYSFRGNFTFARNKIIEDDSAKPAEAYMDTRGTSIGQRFGLVALGLFQSKEEIDGWAKSEFQTNVLPGDIKYVDQNKDGVINNNDIVAIGYPEIPEIMYGFGGTVAYKGFDLTLHFSGVANRSVFLEKEGMYPFMLEYPNFNVYREYYNKRWIPGAADNSKAKYPTVIAGKSEHNYRDYSSTLYMKSGSYVKLQNAEIGYTVPAKFCQTVKLGGIRLFVNGTNLLTFDKVKIMDPEMNIGDAYPQQRVINVGVQLNFN